MKKNSQEKQLIIEGLQIFKPNDRCWMNYTISEENPLTYHHIVPVRNKEAGKTSLNNMALLSSLAHVKFNIIERKDYITAKQLNRLFQALNDTMAPPTEEYYEELKYYIDKYEKKRIRIYIK